MSPRKLVKRVLRGVGADWIASEIRSDLACLYVLSFDPGELPQDRPLPVYVRSNRPNVETRARAQLVIRSESSRLTSRLMAAFTAPEDGDNGNRLTGLIIPTGFEKGKYSALVQVTVPGSQLPRADWNLGISVVSRGSVRHESSGSISVRNEQVPVIFEATVQLAPGPWELTAVAHDTVTDEIVTGLIAGDWPDPKDGKAMIGPIALLQPVYAAFLRDGDVRREGSLGRREGQPVRSDLPTALVGIVCRHRTKSGPLRVERRLLGESSVDFPAIELDSKGEPCAIVSDVIPAGTMAAGMFQYELRVHSDDEDLASGVREFAALTPD